MSLEVRAGLRRVAAVLPWTAIFLAMMEPTIARRSGSGHVT